MPFIQKTTCLYPVKSFRCQQKRGLRIGGVGVNENETMVQIRINFLFQVKIPLSPSQIRQYPIMYPFSPNTQLRRNNSERPSPFINTQGLPLRKGQWRPDRLEPRIPVKVWAFEQRGSRDPVTTFPLPPTHFPGFLRLGLLPPHPPATLPAVATASGLSLELTPAKCLLLRLPPPPKKPMFLSTAPARETVHPRALGGEGKAAEGGGRLPLLHRQKGGREKGHPGVTGGLGSRRWQGPPALG